MLTQLLTMITHKFPSLVVEVDVVDQLDGLGVVDGGPAHRHAQFELPGHLDGEEEPGADPEEEVEHGGDHKHQHRPVQGALQRVSYVAILSIVKRTFDK